MKAFILKPIFFTLIVAGLTIYSAVAQRVITGTVYREGKLAAGVTVEGQKSTGTFMTSFDGKYEITVPEKCKYIKFTFIDDARKLDISENTSNVIDFSFDGEIPVMEETEKGVNLKSSAELVAAGDKDFMSFYTLEKQFYDQKDYKSSIGPWRKLYKQYPKSTVNVYIHGINLYQGFVEKAPDLKTKNIYLDTLMQVYDKRIKYFDEKGVNLGRQGTDYLKYTLDNENLTDDQKKPILKKGYNYVSESVKLQGIESDKVVLLLMMQSTKGLYSLGEYNKEKVIENYDIVSKILNQQVGKTPNDADLVNIRDLVDQIFQTSGAADCDALISIYTPKFDQIASNVEDLKKMIRMLDRQNCDASPLFAKASEKLYSMEPSAEAAYNMARLFVKAEKMDKAETYYKQAIELEKDPLSLSKYYYELATLTYISNPQTAKTYCKKSIENNPSYGKPYLLLGDIYAHASKAYGENDFEHSTVFWVAVDYFVKAKKADPSVEADANEKINLYTQYFPTKEDIFFNKLTVGQSYTVGSWINETTTIREKK
jgi:tetratricopeptide (TPR) repeat protein